MKLEEPEDIREKTAEQLTAQSYMVVSGSTQMFRPSDMAFKDFISCIKQRSS